MSDSLARYAQLKMEQLEIQDELRMLEAAIQKEVEKNGEISGYGFVAKMRPGRKSVDHLQAVMDSKVSSDVVQKFTTTKTTTAWAKVTKAAGINLLPYTTQGQEYLEIKPIL